MKINPNDLTSALRQILTNQQKIYDKLSELETKVDLIVKSGSPSEETGSVTVGNSSSA